ncbi:MAG: hypothetical protein SGI77_07495 [Pirellulaceae bacterium]|nr:hypothetical protein [Pirellulaceae bacterium]
MDTKNLSYMKILWIGGFASLFYWHVGVSLAQSPSDIQRSAESHLLSSSPPVVTATWSDAKDTSIVVPASYTLPANSASYAVSSNSLPQMDWASSVSNAMLNLRAESLPNPTQAKTELENAVAQLQNFLATSSSERFANWLSFLHWNELQQELGKKEPDIEQLVQIERNMRQNYLGLEMSQFVRVRDRLSDYIDALRFGSNPKETLEILSKRLEQLSVSLQTPSAGADTERQREIGLITTFLDQSKQAVGLKQSVQSQFAKANVRVLVSSEFVQRQFSRAVAEPSPVSEVILGTQIRGCSFMQGSVTPLLVDNSSNASLRLMLSGEMNSTTIGTNRKVLFHTQGYSNITACETISLTDHGLLSQNDTSVFAPLQTTIVGIEHKLKIVRRIAARKAAEQKPQADAIAQGRLETRVSTQFHQQLTKQLSQTNAKLQNPPMPILHRLGLSEPKRTSWSSNQFLTLLWKQQESDQLAAPTSCPLAVQHRGISVQLHQSVIMNLLDPVLGGRIVRNEDLDDFVAQAGLDPTEGLRNEVGGEKWAISMAGYHPIEVEFDDQLVRFRIRTTKLDRGDQALEQPATIEATYKVVLNDGSIQFERQGDVKIEFAGKAQRGLRAVTLRSFLKNKFDSVFKQELLDKPIRPTDRLPADAPRMTITDIQIDDGWIQATLM